MNSMDLPEDIWVPVALPQRKTTWSPSGVFMQVEHDTDVLHPDHDVPDDSLLDDSCLPAYDSQDPLHAILTTLETKFDLE